MAISNAMTLEQKKSRFFKFMDKVKMTEVMALKVFPYVILSREQMDKVVLSDVEFAAWNNLRCLTKDNKIVVEMVPGWIDEYFEGPATTKDTNKVQKPADCLPKSLEEKSDQQVKVEPKLSKEEAENHHHVQKAKEITEFKKKQPLGQKLSTIEKKPVTCPIAARETEKKENKPKEDIAQKSAAAETKPKLHENRALISILNATEIPYTLALSVLPFVRLNKRETRVFKLPQDMKEARKQLKSFEIADEWIEEAVREMEKKRKPFFNLMNSLKLTPDLVLSFLNLRTEERIEMGITEQQNRRFQGKLYPWMKQNGVRGYLARMWVRDKSAVDSEAEKEENRSKEDIDQKSSGEKKLQNNRRKDRFLLFSENVTLTAELLVKLLPYSDFSEEELKKTDLSKAERSAWRKLAGWMKAYGATSETMERWIAQGRLQNIREAKKSRRNSPPS